ncbi:MAG: Gfo/Idh/MocA family protein [Thermomicrobiales bacterium]
MHTYQAALVGCGRIGAFIDNEVIDRGSSVLPYSHAAGYEACARTQLVAGADLRPDVLAAFGERYGVTHEHLYTDYQDMIRAERPEILSIATQPQDRATVALFAIEHGVRALYCEKPLCSSLAETAAIAAAVERHGVVFNMGTNRRWHPGYAAMRDAVASDEYGTLKLLITSSTCTLFNTASHWFDLLLYLNGDAPASWVQAFLPNGEETFEGNQVVIDPLCQGTIAFGNGVMAHLIASPQPIIHEAICERATVRATRHDTRFEVHRVPGNRSVAEAYGQEVLSYEPSSATLALIDDLVHALDTGGSTRGGIDVARVNSELIFGFLESHRRHGARVSLPLTESPLTFAPRNTTPRQPKYAP